MKGMNLTTLTSRPDVLWQAVALRNADADGLFVYAVKSTGVYCRPSCPSRRPRRDRVEFYPAPAMAEAGGFRACRRCHPDQAIAGPPPLARVRRACEAVAARPDAAWTSATLAKAGGTTTVQLQSTMWRTDYDLEATPTALDLFTVGGTAGQGLGGTGVLGH